MQGRSNLTPIWGITAPRCRVIGTDQLDHLTRGISHYFATGDQIAIAQPDLAPGRQAIKVFGRVFHKIITLDVELRPERNAPHAGGRILRVVNRIELLTSARRMVLDDELQWAQDSHSTYCGLVQALADRVLEHRDVDNAVGPGDPDATDKFTDRHWRHAAAPQRRQ